MLDSKQKIQVVCAEGHVLDAPMQAVGKTLPCPVCQSPVTVPSPEKKQLTDTSVMRILGDRISPPEPVAKTVPSATKRDKLSDTGVMRILGDCEPPAMMKSDESPRTRPCPACSFEVTESASVCQQCNCYIGASPDYLRSLTQTRN